MHAISSVGPYRGRILNEFSLIMADQDQKPFHAKTAAPGQEAADVVAEVLAHAAERDQAANRKEGPKGPPKWMLPLTVNLGVLALYFLIARPDFIHVTQNEDPRTTVEVNEQSLSAMGLVYGQLQGYLVDNGRVPADLAELQSPYTASFRYTVVGDSTYVLSFERDDGTVVSFNSGTDDPDTFFPPLPPRSG